MYEICQNEFRLGVTGDRHFSSRDEYDLDVKFFIHRYSSPRWIDTGSNSVFKSFREKIEPSLTFFYDRSKAING